MHKRLKNDHELLSFLWNKAKYKLMNSNLSSLVNLLGMSLVRFRNKASLPI